MATNTSQLAIDGGTPIFSEPINKDLVTKKVGEEDVEAVAAFMRGGLRGDPVGEFSQAFAQACGVSHGVGVCSGTAAVHAGTFAAGVEPGDEVILPAISDVGSVKGILAQNAIPIFADVDLRTCNIDPADVEAKITERTKAILAVHLYGQPADMDALMEIGRRHSLPVIEDGSQAHFAEYKGRKVGSIGEIGVFSLIAGKHLHTVAGGIVITNDDAYAEKAKFFGVDRGERDGLRDGLSHRGHFGLGLNYKMNPLGGVVGLVQLRKLDDNVARRRQLAHLLGQLIEDIPGLGPQQVIDGAAHSYWLRPIAFEPDAFTVNCYGFALALREEGVPSSCKGYYLLYDHPAFLDPVPQKYPDYALPRAVYDGRVSYHKGMCPAAEQALTRHFTISWSEHYSEEDMEGVAKAMRKVAEAYRA